MLEERLGRDVLGADKVLDGRLGAGDPRSEVGELGRLEAVTDGAESLDTVQRLADDTRDEGRGGGRGHTGTHDDGGETEDTAVDKASAGVLVDEHLGDELAGTVRAFGRGDC